MYIEYVTGVYASSFTTRPKRFVYWLPRAEITEQELARFKWLHEPGNCQEDRLVRKVFHSNIISETVLVRDALLQHGIEATTQNEHSGYSAVPEFRPPAEIWITNDADYGAARRLVEETLATIDSKTEKLPWQCANCKAENPDSFEVCWSCGEERGPAAQ